MIDYKTVEIIIKTWVKSVTGLANDKVISQNDNHARPTGQYATVKIFNPKIIGHDTYKVTNAANNTVDLNYGGVRELMIGINIYRDDTETAMNQMAKLTSSFNRLDTQIYFNSLNIGIINTSEIRDLSSVINELWEERRQADFFLYANDADVVNVEAIMKIAGTGFDTDYIVDSTL